jgi:hypothetical protein
MMDISGWVEDRKNEAEEDEEVPALDFGEFGEGDG